MTVPVTLRIMGEIDIHTVPGLTPSEQTPKSLSAAIAPLSALDDANTHDIKNWLGDQLDKADADESGPSDAEMKLIEDAAALLLYQQAEENSVTYQADSFVLMLVLRERWPVGSKAKLRDVAARAGAAFSYNLVVCPPQPFTDASDDEAVAKAEAASLAEMLPALKRARKQFASSSGLQQFLNNA
jgi:hypothetical protein